jgi:peptidoglycan/LPS O-acetylase OafA/YrhL
VAPRCKAVARNELRSERLYCSADEPVNVNSPLAPEESTTQPAHAQARHGVEHYPHLDGLRALAVFGVLVTHFLPAEHTIRRLFNWGEAGVQLFFVLSGFLITCILLRSRERIERGQPLTRALRTFYIRRFLRICPVFYAAIALFALTDLGMMRETWPWHVTYLSNVALIVKGGGLGHTTHFWTLAVEEQFYLVWPIAIILLPERWLFPGVIAAAASAPVFRLAAAALPVPFFVRYALPPACLDALGLGAAYALARTFVAEPRSLNRWLAGSLVLGLAIILGLTAFGDHSRIGSALNTVFMRSGLACVSLWIVARAARGFGGIAGRVLGWWPLAYVGRISYGIYVLHHFVPEALARVPLGRTVAAWPLPLAFLIWSAVSVAVASVSWHLLESPINELKRLFPYDSSPRSVTAPSPRTSSQT